MHLSTYMAQNGLSDGDMAALIGKSRPTVSRIRRRLVRPHWKTIQQIERVTEQAVTANDFVELERAG